jgi:hypothetical protein
MFDEFLMRIRDFEAQIVALHTHLQTMGSNVPKEAEPVAEAWIPAYLDGVSGDFTAEMLGSKAKTELASVRERGLLGHIAASVPWVQFLRNFRQLTAFEQAELILHAGLDPSVASRARKGECVKR